MRREGAVLNGSLTIIVLTPLTTFSAPARNHVGKSMNSLGYFHRDVGSSKGPPQARGRVTRAFAMPCADPCANRARWDTAAGPDAYVRHAAPGARRLRLAAGFA